MFYPPDRINRRFRYGSWTSPACHLARLLVHDFVLKSAYQGDLTARQVTVIKQTLTGVKNQKASLAEQ